MQIGEVSTCTDGSTETALPSGQWPQRAQRVLREERARRSEQGHKNQPFWPLWLDRRGLEPVRCLGTKHGPWRATRSLGIRHQSGVILAVL
jgi:hypothetical protein